jgi:hypothetical protein
VRWERRSGLQVPEVLIEAGANIVVKAESVRVIAICRPLRLGDCPSFYRQRREQFTGVPHCSPTCEGIVSSATELATVLANLAPVGASWRVLCPTGAASRVVEQRLAAQPQSVGRLEGAVDGGPYEV